MAIAGARRQRWGGHWWHGVDQNGHPDPSEAVNLVGGGRSNAAAADVEADSIVSRCAARVEREAPNWLA